MPSKQINDFLHEANLEKLSKWPDLLVLLFPCDWSVFEVAEGTLSSFIFFSDMDFTGGRDWRGIPLVLGKLVAPEVFGGGVLRSII